MKRHRYIIILSFLVLVCQARAGRIVRDSIFSAVLHHQVICNLYLPDQYQVNREARFPVLYLLHGLSDTYSSWAEKGQLQVVVDELTRSGEVRPMVIIMPNAGGPNIQAEWNGYFDMPGWPYEQFFFQELMPTLEKKYRIVSDKAHRAISGLSMGGGGSIVYAQRHPDLFSSCYAMSAWSDADEPKTSDDRGDGNNKFFLVNKSVHEHSALTFLDNADDAVKKALRTVKWFVDCGDDDFLLQTNETFHMKMRTMNIPCELRVRDGIHNWEYWHTALRTSLPFASRNFGN